jgi:kinetochore protein Mis13/DSN1
MLTIIQEETAPPPVVKKPNPQNEKNKATLQGLEEEVRRCVVSPTVERTCANLSTDSKKKRPPGKF